MKRCLYIVSLLMLAFSGCQKAEVQSSEKDVVLSDFRGELEGFIDTKTVLDRNNNVRWSEGDQVIIFNGSTLGGKYQVTDDSVGETSAGFDYIENAAGGFVSGSDIEHNVALYPFDSKVKCAKGDDKEPTESYILTKVKALSEQNYVKDSFGPGTFPMVAVTSSVSDYRLNFKNVFGGMKLQLKGDCTVSSITVKGQASEPIAGTVSVTAFVDGSAPTVSMGSDATDAVTLDCGEYGVELNEETATNFIIALPPTTFKSGFTVSIVDTEGRLMIIKTSKENKIYRSSLLKMPEITVDASKTASIELPETETVIASAASTFDVAVNANVEYEVVMPAVDWLHLENASGASCQTFSVDENTEYDSRSADIVFKSKVHDQQRTFTVTQLQKDAIILAKDTYDIDIKGGTLAIDLQTNVDFEVSIASDAQSWISHVSTRALENKVLTLSIASCSEDVDRTGAVVLTKDGLSQTINIHQYSMISKEPIVFADANVKKACVAAFDTDGDGEVSYKEAAAARSLSGVFDRYRTITSFDEFQYFTAITSIPSELFKDCTILKSITFPESLRTIGSYAFSGCTNLKKIHVTKNVYSIGGMAFYNCKALATLTFDDEISSLSFGSVNYNTRYAGPFYLCTALTEVRIPAAVTSLGSGLFEGCSSLKKVTFQEGSKLMYIDASDWNYTTGPFGGCSALEQIVLPETLTKIGREAFYGCSSLLTINIPEGVSEIGDYAFYNCKKLDGIEIPEACRSIGRCAFQNCSILTKIHLPDNCTVVGSSAFYGCESLADVKLSFAQTLIDGSTFYNCKSLVSIELPEYLASVGSSAFSGCSSLSSIVIPDNVTELGNSAFYGCSNLASATLGPGLTSIDGSAFSGCSSLSSVVIPDNVTELGSSAFYRCSALTSATLGTGLTTIGSSAFNNCSSLSSIIIPDNVKELGSSAFSGCSALTSATLGTGLTTIGSSAFYGCSALTSATFGTGLTTIGSSAFYNCSSLSSIVIPDNVTELGSSAFCGCSALTSATLGTGLTTIGSEAFRDCSSLSSIAVPDDVTMIGSYAFYGCTSLSSATLGSGLSSIGAYAFSGCSSLSSATLGSGLTTIGEQAFYDCSSLSSIIVPDNVTVIGNSAFEGCSSLSSATLGTALTTIGSEAFRDCSSLSSIAVPDNVAEIKYRTFSGCSSLSSATLGTGLTTIGAEAFYNCSSLSSIAIPDNVISIASYAFEYCSSLTSATLGTGLTTIGSNAFSSCSSLSSIIIPENVTSIGSSAFRYCYELASVICLPVVPPTLGSSAFSNNKSGRIISVPEASVDAYKSSWSSYASYIQAMTESL